MSSKIDNQFWPATHYRLRLCAKFTAIIKAQMASEGNGVKVIELQAYCDWKQGVFPEASNNLT